MSKPFRNYQNTLFLITPIFFALGFIHISLALLGILCFTIPLIQYKIYHQQIWCKYYCPRAGLFVKLLTKVSLHKPLPKIMRGPRLKKFFLTYFTLNLFFASMSTLMVSLGRMEAMEYLRFFIILPLPFEFPQLLNLSFPSPLLHFSYRIYSMMFSTTVIGIILGFLYLPRAWCTICPMMSLTKGKLTS